MAGRSVNYRLLRVQVHQLNLHIFLTSRQVYFESAQIFYKNDTFDFWALYRTLDSVLNCPLFLDKRPLGALTYIQELRLLVGDQPQSIVYHNVPLKSWKILCDKIAKEMSLSQMVVYIREDCVATSTRNWMYQDELEHQKNWRGQLFRITG